MFHDRSLAILLPAAAFAVLALSFAPGALAQFEEEVFDPGAPPSDFPNHSGEMNNFGSKFIYSTSEPFKNGATVVFQPRATVNCSTCGFGLLTGSTHTFKMSGRVWGQEADVGPEGEIIPKADTAGVYDMTIDISGVKAEILGSQDLGNGFFEQTIKYTANILDGAVLSGQFVLVKDATPTPTNPVPEGENPTIKVEARIDPDTRDLVKTGPNETLTFPERSANDPGSMGQAIAANVVFQVTETKRVPCSRAPNNCSSVIGLN